MCVEISYIADTLLSCASIWNNPWYDLITCIRNIKWWLSFSVLSCRHPCIYLCVFTAISRYLISWPTFTLLLYHCVWSVITAHNLTPEKRENNYGRPASQMRTLYFCPVVSSSFFFPRLISAVANWMSTVLPHMVWPYSANLGCRSETCYTPLAENTGHKNRQKFAICALSHNIDGFIFATRPKARIDNRKKTC